MSRAPRLHFSFRSPFSWMTVERLLRSVPDAHDRIRFVPFWDPDPETGAALTDRSAELPYTPMSKAKHLYILQDTKRLATRLGLAMRWPVDVDCWWERPHLAWLLADELGRGAQFYQAIVAARWLRGEDVCRPEVIHTAAVEAGLDGAELERAVHDPRIRARGVECLVAAYEDDIFGVPYLRTGPHRFWGYDRLDAFLEAFPSTSPPASPAPADLRDVPLRVRTAVGSYDRDTAGGCG